MRRRRRRLAWLVTVVVLALATAATRAWLRGEDAGILWLAALASSLALYGVWRPASWSSLARGLGLILSGPAVSWFTVMALRTWVPSDGPFLSAYGVLRELAHSPAFYLPLAFTVSWSLLGLRVRRPPAGRLRDRWSYAPFLVWSLFASRDLIFYFDSGLNDMPPAAQADILWLAGWVLLTSLLTTLAATVPTLLQDRGRGEHLRLELAALLPVWVVLVDWGLLLTIFTKIWLLPAG